MNASAVTWRPSISRVAAREIKLPLFSGLAALQDIRVEDEVLPGRQHHHLNLIAELLNHRIAHQLWGERGRQLAVGFCLLLRPEKNGASLPLCPLYGLLGFISFA